jgi:hypothetical protein
VVAVAGARDEVSAASAEEALRTALEPLAPLWRLEPPAAESPLLIVAGR